MADNEFTKLFGFEFRRAGKKDENKQKLKSVIAPQNDDGAGYVTASGSHFGQYVDNNPKLELEYPKNVFVDELPEFNEVGRTAYRMLEKTAK